MDTNPLLDEINGLSPGAKQALMQAHAAGTTAATLNTGPGAIQKPQPQAAPPEPMSLQAPSTMPQVPQIGRSVQAPPGTVPYETNRLGKIEGQKPALDTIYSRISGSHFGQEHPIAGKILGALAQVPATAANVALSAGLPRIGALTPGTTINHQLETRGAESRLATAIGNQQKEAQTREANARIPLEAAQTENLLHPPSEALPTDEGYYTWNPRTGEINPLKGEGGEPLTPFVKPGNAQHVVLEGPDGKPMLGFVDPVTKTTTDAQGHPIANPVPFEKPTNQNDFEQFYKDWLAENKAADTASSRKRAREEWVAASQAPQRPPQVMVFTPNASGGQTAQLVRPGQDIAPGAQTAQGVNAMNTPTTQMRNVAAQATLVHEQTPETLSLIDKNKDKIGPMSGRWNKFMQGDIGAPDQDMADLRADLLMYSSAVALAHASGRLPENLREEFDHAINAPNQSAENLSATVRRIDEWMTKNAEMGQRPGSKPPQDSSSKGNISVKSAMGLPQNRGKSEADVRKDIEAHGYTPTD